MSTGIYNGYIYRRGHRIAADDLLPLARRMRVFLRRATMRMFLKGAAAELAAFVDRVHLGVRMEKITPETTPLEYIRSVVENQHQLQSFERWSWCQTAPTYFLFPVRGRLLVYFAGSNELEDVFRRFPGLSDYHYGTVNDRPPRISAREWEQRRRDWIDHLQFDAPATSGLGNSVWGFLEPSCNSDEFLKIEAHMPPLQQRVENQIEARLFEEFTKDRKVTVQNCGRFWMECREFSRTPQGIAATTALRHRITAKLPRKVTHKLLKTPCGEMPGFAGAGPQKS